MAPDQHPTWRLARQETGASTRGPLVPWTPEPWRPCSSQTSAARETAPPTGKSDQRRPSSIALDSAKVSRTQAEEWAAMAAAEIIQPVIQKPDDESADGGNPNGEESESSEDHEDAKCKCKCGNVLPSDCSQCSQCCETRKKRPSSVGEYTRFSERGSLDPCVGEQTTTAFEIPAQGAYGRELFLEHSNIAVFFDGRGFPGAATPKNWGLTACQTDPCHQSWPSKNDRTSAFSRRAKMVNAKMTLQADQLRRQQEISSEKEIRASSSEYRYCDQGLSSDDVQQKRYLRLLFDPIQDLSSMPEKEILDETIDKYEVRKKGMEKSRKAKELWGLLRKYSHAAQTICAMKKNAARTSDFTGKNEVAHHAPAPSTILSNGQRTTLLTIFQRYVLRVSAGTGGADLMARSTWFRFLHHCGLLGPSPDEAASASVDVRRSVRVKRASMGAGELSSLFGGALPSVRSPSSDVRADPLDYGRQGGVSFCYASSVFNMYKEGSVNPLDSPSLTFTSWVNAIQHIMRGPTFYRTQTELLANLFGVILKRCEQIMGIQPSILPSTPGPRARQKSNMSQDGRRSPKRASQASQPYKRSGTQVLTSEILRTFVDENKIENNEKPAIGVLGWQSDRAEEEMCEPEVLVLLHEFEAPLYSIFKHYASRRRKPPNPATLAPASFSTHRCRDNLRLAGAREGDNQDGGSDDGGLSNASTDESWDAEASDKDGDDHAENAIPTEAGTSAKAKAKESEELGVKNRNSRSEVRMDTDTFLVMVHEFGFYPKIVQVHSVRQHLEITLARSKNSKLSYEAFIECLLRISFVYLNIYGNTVQQSASSKAKCIWLLTFLRARYKQRGLGRRMKTQDRGEGEDMVAHRKTGHDWRRTLVDLDKLPLQRLVLWPAIDVKVGPPMRRLAVERQRNSFE